MTLRITQPRRIPRSDGLVRHSASVAGQELWFDIPSDRAGDLRGEPFLSCLIVPAMVQDVAIELDPSLPVCPDFLAGVHAYMQVVRFWPVEIGHALHPIPIRAETEPPSPGVGTASFFSGGIDGLYTLLEERSRITEAVFCHGVDFQLDSALATEATTRNRAWLADRGLPLLEMASNARFVGRALGVGWNAHNGACLAGYGHALGVREVLIASGHAWLDWMGGGTHVLSDPLLSSAATRVHHHGHGPMRWQKLARVLAEPGVPELLRVCWQDTGYNCGTCEKCRRTMLDLHLIGVTSPAFPSTRQLSEVLPSRAEQWEAACYLRQTLRLAQHVGRHDVAAVVRSRLRDWERRLWLRRADAAFLGGALRRLHRRR
ncbi:MAG TPA: hypothetical protein VFN22_11775 [Gemmatimonadales bacterium]|nr:hypothetical protein [Gemmatimonadales bacterium]